MSTARPALCRFLPHKWCAVASIYGSGAVLLRRTLGCERCGLIRTEWSDPTYQEDE